MSKKIDRREATKKLGKYAAMTAVGTFAILNPKTAQAASPTSARTSKSNPFNY